MNILCIDIGGTAIKSALINCNENIIQFKETPSDGKLGGKEVINKVQNIISTYSDYIAIGISTAGQVDKKLGSIIYANENIPNYTGMEIKKILEQQFNIPVKVENDVNAAAIGECFYGAGKNYNDFLCLTYGTGIGGSIVINRQIYYGANGIAAEFGHLITHSNSKDINSNSKDINSNEKRYYEKYASTTALIESTMNLRTQYSNGREVFKHIHIDKQLNSIVDSWIDEIVLGLISLTHTFNPETIILGGGIMNQNYIIENIRKKLINNVIESYRGVIIQKASLGNKAGLFGAYHIAKKAYNFNIC